MPDLTRRGVTLAELLVGVLVGSIVVTAAVRAFVVQHRHYRDQAESVGISRTLAAVEVLLTTEFAGLVPAAPRGGDLLRMEPTVIRYRALRQLYVVCRRSPAGSHTLAVTDDWISSDPFDATADSVLVLLPGPDGVERWWHGDAALEEGPSCGPARPGFTLLLGGPVPASVPVGTPVRAGSVMEIRAYPTRRDVWIGVRSIPKEGNPGPVQPAVGPFERGGVRFALVDGAEREVTDPARAAGLVVYVTPTGWRAHNPVRAPARLLVAFRSARP